MILITENIPTFSPKKTQKLPFVVFSYLFTFGYNHTPVNSHSSYGILNLKYQVLSSIIIAHLKNTYFLGV